MNMDAVTNMFMAVEFGYKAHESGKSLAQALLEMHAIIFSENKKEEAKTT